MVDSIKTIFDAYGYEFYEEPFKLNIIGIRKKLDTNFFDDELWVIYKDDSGKYVEHKFPFTTDPGRTSLLNAKNNSSKGTAILVAGQYKDTYAIDAHRGNYLALCQRLGPVCVYRDKNANSVHDLVDSTVECGFFGINIHRTGRVISKLVDGWSAGCQVLPSPSDFKVFMDLCKEHAKRHKNKFTYTLLQM